MISIHYQGTSEPKTMRKLISELKAISDEMHWKYFVIDDEKFVGILVSTHEKCEPLSFIIDKQGRLIHPAWLNDDNPLDFAFYVSTKTHFSTVDTHIAIVKLLKYIKKKYLIDINVIDEGDYYETEDRELLQQKWDFLLKKFEEIGSLLENKLADEDKKLSANDLADKIERIIQKRFLGDVDTEQTNHPNS